MTEKEILKSAREYLESEILELKIRLKNPNIKPHKRRELEAQLKAKNKLLAHYTRG